MSYTERQVWDLLERAREMPYGSAQIALVEQVIAHADAQHMAEASFEARMVGTNAYTYGGEPAKAFVTFSWCLAEYDREPGRYSGWTHTLLWHFKYMISGLTRFPEIPLARTQAVLDDMERRWRDGGHSLHAVYSHRHLLARHVGDYAQAQEWYERWCAAPRDSLSDCVGCDPSAKASWLSDRGRDEEAVALAEPVLAGRLTCSEQPQNMLTTLLLPYLRTSRLEQARDAHRRAYRLHRPHLADLSDIADHIRFCALTGNEARGLELLERHLDWLDRAPSPFAAMWFSMASALLLRRLAETGHADALLHRRGHGERPDGDIGVDALRTELSGNALALAARFDARNGTTYQSDRVRALLAQQPIVDHLPLGVAGSRATRIVPAPVETPKQEADLTHPVPGDLSVDELLDRAEAAYLADREQEAYASWHAVDERFPELTVPQRARRLDGAASEAANARHDLDAAEATWREAEALYAQAGDEVRRQVVRGRLGYLLCETGRVEAGLPLVESSTSYLVNEGPKRLWSRARLRLAIVLLAAQRFDEALGVVERAEADTEESGEPELPAQVATIHAQVLGALRRLPEAAAVAAEARKRCRERGLTEPLAGVSWWHGVWLQEIGDDEAAVEAYQEAVENARDLGLRRQAAVQRAAILAGSPRAAEAVDDLVEAVASLVAEGDGETAARVQHRLAIAYLNANRPLDAAEVAEEALASFEATGDAAAFGVRDLLAAVYQRLGQPDAAIEQLTAIEAELARRGHADRGETIEQIAELLDGLDRDAAAAEKFAAAADAYAAAGRSLDEVRTRRRTATSLLWSGDREAALAALERVENLAAALPPEQPVAIWELAMIDYDASKILVRSDREYDAIARAESAAARFRSIDAPVQSAHSEAMRGELLFNVGRSAEAVQALRAALAELPEDGGGQERIADRLADALDALGREAEADAVRRQYGVM